MVWEAVCRVMCYALRVVLRFVIRDLVLMYNLATSGIFFNVFLLSLLM